MRWKVAKVVMEKDIREIGTSWQFWAPTVIVPLLMFVIIPLAVILLAQYAGLSSSDLDELTKMMAKMPEAMLAPVRNMSTTQASVYFFFNQFLAPMFLIVPIMVSSIIAANSFAGERERRTIESLFYSSATDEELYFGKVLAAFIPAVVVSLASFLILTITANVAGRNLFGYFFFPSPTWIMLILLLIPAITFLSLAFTVLVSMRARGFQEAQQMGALLVLPVMLLLFGQISGVFFLSPRTIPILAGIIALVDFWLVRMGARSLNREKIITQLR